MKAVVLHGQRDIRVEQVDVPKVSENEVLIRVRATGVCGSDIPRVFGTGARYYPIILGHEFSGEVAKLGSGDAIFNRLADQIKEVLPDSLWPEEP
jgi:L-iditol 2-dehydrogenase